MDGVICLVTGVAGFIGSHLASRLVNRGYCVVGIDCFTDYYPRKAKERNLAALRRHSSFHFVEADLLSVDIESLIRDVRTMGTNAMAGQLGYIYHLAAQPGVRDSWGRSFEIYLRNNVLATQRLLEASKDLDLKKFVFASSSSIYGDAETFPTSEDVIPCPVSPYGVTKLAVENLAWLYWRLHGVPTVGLRYFTVYGPRQRPDMAFHRFIQAMFEGREIVVFGNGEQTRDFTFVDDAVEATLLAGSSDLVGTAINVGGGSNVSVNHVIRILELILDSPASVRYSKPGEGDVRHTSADTNRAEAIGYRPRTSLLEGLHAEVDWLRAISRGPVSKDSEIGQEQEAVRY